MESAPRATSRHTVGFITLIVADKADCVYLNTILFRLTNEVAGPGLADSNTENDELRREPLRGKISSVGENDSGADTHGEDGPDE